MDVLVTVLEDAPAEHLRSLRGWLLQEDELRGTVRLIESPPAPGELGPTVDALQVAAGSVSTAFVAALVAWLRTRVGRVRIKLKSERGAEVELDATVVRRLDAAGVSALATTLLSSLEEAPPRKKIR